MKDPHREQLVNLLCLNPDALSQRRNCLLPSPAVGLQARRMANLRRWLLPRSYAVLLHQDEQRVLST